MPILFRILLLFITVTITFSCSKDDEDSQEESGFLNLNGTWEGETRILQAGDCASGDPSWTPVELLVTVDDNGNVSINTETQFDPQDMMWHIIIGTKWMGRIEANDSVFLTKTFIVDCFGTDVSGSSDYASKLIRNGNTIRLNLNSEEVFCPDQNCVFDRSYVVTLTN